MTNWRNIFGGTTRTMPTRFRPTLVTLDERAVPNASTMPPPETPPSQTPTAPDVVLPEIQAGEYILLQDSGGVMVGWYTRDTAGNDWLRVGVGVDGHDFLLATSASSEMQLPNLPPPKGGPPVVGDPPPVTAPPGTPPTPPAPPPPGPDPRGAVIGGAGAIPSIYRVGGYTITAAPWGTTITRGLNSITIYPNGSIWGSAPAQSGWIIPPPAATPAPQE